MNFFPDTINKIYLIGICGTGMASLAGLLQEQGFTVCGSDANVYPPMSDELKKQGIPIFSPFDANNLKNAKPDLVIVGNAITRLNPESKFLLESGLPHVSMPQALKHFFLKDKEVIVISGTHGKTTTTALMAYLLDRLGLDPSYLIGGVCHDFGKSFHVGKGKYFVIEGDEYDTAFFDKGPKFLHYNPKHVVMTSIEFDHADIYRDLPHVTQSFLKLATIIPSHGSLHFCDAYPALNEVASTYSGPKRCYGFSTPEWHLDHFESSPMGCHFDLSSHGKKIVSLKAPLSGRHNALNIATCFSILENLGLDLQKAAGFLSSFKGIKRRQEVLYEDPDFIVMDDFAHHPTAVTETILAVKSKYPKHRVVAVFEPRSNTSIRDIFQKEYTESFAHADETLLAPVFNPKKITDGRILNVEEIISTLNARQHTAHHFANATAIIEHLVHHAKKPLVVLIMSNGGFDNIHSRLIKAWQDNHRP